MKSQDNCADLGTKTLTAGTLSLLRNLNGLVDKNTMDDVSCGVQSITISPGEPRSSVGRVGTDAGRDYKEQSGHVKD